jgi:hypothetical protein
MVTPSRRSLQLIMVVTAIALIVGSIATAVSVVKPTAKPGEWNVVITIGALQGVLLVAGVILLLIRKRFLMKAM